MSKCPKCDKNVANLRITPHTGQHSMTSYKCITFDCPLCGAVLGAAMDPYAMRDEIANAVKKKIAGG